MLNYISTIVLGLLLNCNQNRIFGNAFHQLVSPFTVNTASMPGKCSTILQAFIIHALGPFHSVIQLLSDVLGCNMVDRKASAVSVKANDYAVCKSRLQNFLFLFSQTFTVHCTLDIVHCTLVQTATSASEVTTM